MRREYGESSKIIIEKFIDDVLSKFKLAKTPSYLEIDYDDIEDSQIIASAHAVNAKVITRDNEMLGKYPGTAISPQDYLQIPADMNSLSINMMVSSSVNLMPRN